MIYDITIFQLVRLFLPMIVDADYYVNSLSKWSTMCVQKTAIVRAASNHDYKSHVLQKIINQPNNGQFLISCDITIFFFVYIALFLAELWLAVEQRNKGFWPVIKLINPSAQLVTNGSCVSIRTQQIRDQSVKCTGTLRPSGVGILLKFPLMWNEVRGALAPRFPPLCLSTLRLFWVCSWY